MKKENQEQMKIMNVKASVKMNLQLLVLIMRTLKSILISKQNPTKWKTKITTDKLSLLQHFKMNFISALNDMDMADRKSKLSIMTSTSHQSAILQKSGTHGNNFAKNSSDCGKTILCSFHFKQFGQI